MKKLTNTALTVLFMNLAYEWGAYDSVGQEASPYRRVAMSRCLAAKKEIVHRLSVVGENENTRRSFA